MLKFKKCTIAFKHWYWPYKHIRLYYTCKAEGKALFTEGSEEMDEMTSAELNQYLENIAKLIEATAEDVATAAEIVRESKINA